MTPKKTISVQFVLEAANMRLALDDVSDDYREGVSELLQVILFETDNYNGYGNVGWLNFGHRIWTRIQKHLPDPSMSPAMTDEYHRRYY